MGKRFFTGIMLGAVATMFIMPELDRSTKRKMRRTAKNVRCMAEEACDNMKKIIG